MKLCKGAACVLGYILLYGIPLILPVLQYRFVFISVDGSTPFGPDETAIYVSDRLAAYGMTAVLLILFYLCYWCLRRPKGPLILLMSLQGLVSMFTGFFCANLICFSFIRNHAPLAEIGSWIMEEIAAIGYLWALPTALLILCVFLLFSKTPSKAPSKEEEENFVPPEGRDKEHSTLRLLEEEVVWLPCAHRVKPQWHLWKCHFRDTCSVCEEPVVMSAKGARTVFLLDILFFYFVEFALGVLFAVLGWISVVIFFVGLPVGLYLAHTVIRRIVAAHTRWEDVTYC